MGSISGSGGSGGGKLSFLEGAPPAVLADVIKHAHKRGLRGTDNATWHEWVATLPAARRHKDPARHAPETLLRFLAAARAAAGGGEGKDLERYAKWRLAAAEDEASERRLRAFLATSTSGGGGKKRTGDNTAAAAPKNDAAARAAAVWRLVDRTAQHPKFARAYTFPSHEKGWRVTGRRAGAAGRVEYASAPPRLLAVDCEMCETSKDANALLSVAVVDEAGGVVFESLVKPRGRIIDLRTHITGVTQDALDKGPTITRRAAAKRLCELLGPNVALVGHSLSADLRALKVDHRPVIDTACLFQYRGLAAAAPSLVHLSALLLNRRLRAGGGEDGGGKEGGSSDSSNSSDSDSDSDSDSGSGGTSSDSSSGGKAKKRKRGSGKHAAATAANGGAINGGGGGGGGGAAHDSREDADAAMALVRFEVAAELRGAPTPPVEPPALRAPKDDLKKLLVHALPPADALAAAGGAEAAVSRAFAAAGAPAPAAFEPGARPAQLLLVFPNAAVADTAFAALPGHATADSVGRRQKVLSLPDGAGRARVRKMACHGGLLFGKDMVGDRGAKKRKQAPPPQQLLKPGHKQLKPQLKQEKKQKPKQLKPGQQKKQQKQQHKAAAAVAKKNEPKPTAAAAAPAAAQGGGGGGGASDAKARAEKRRARAAQWREGGMPRKAAKKRKAE